MINYQHKNCRNISRYFSCTNYKSIVTCRPTARERVDKHVSVKMDSWKPTHYETCFLGYENESCSHGDRFLKINTLLWNQQKFPRFRMRYICVKDRSQSQLRAEQKGTRMEPVAAQSRTKRDQNGASRSSEQNKKGPE
jgi:hypothetical protein